MQKRGFVYYILIVLLVVLIGLVGYKLSVKPTGYAILDDPSLVMYMDFDTNEGSVVSDKSGSGNDGTVNGATWTSSGKYNGGAYEFDGVNDYIDLESPALLNLESGYSISAWVYRSPSTGGSVVRKGNVFNTGFLVSQFWLAIDSSGDIDFRTGNGTNSCRTIVYATDPITSNTWHYVVITVNDSISAGFTKRVTQYVDGNYFYSGNCDLSGSYVDSNRTIMGLGTLNSLTGPFNGTIDEVMIFDKVLSASEISNIYNNNLGGPGAVCGNGIVEGAEQCDDGNTVSGDGCSSSCTTEAAAVCGNSVIESGEQCDDGNTVSGDGCSSSCVTEVGGLSVSITSPANNAVVQRVINITTSVQGVNIQSVEFLVDGTKLAGNVTAPYSTSFNTSLVPNGLHVLQSKVFDLNGTSASSNLVNISVNNALNITILCEDIDSDGYNMSKLGCGIADCNDNNTLVYPGAAEVCGDSIDNNCDGDIDESCLEEEVSESGRVRLGRGVSFIEIKDEGEFMIGSEEGGYESAFLDVIGKRVILKIFSGEYDIAQKEVVPVLLENGERVYLGITELEGENAVVAFGLDEERVREEVLGSAVEETAGVNYVVIVLVVLGIVIVIAIILALVGYSMLKKKETEEEDSEDNKGG